MKVRIRTERFKLAFDGSPAIWNEFMRPILGGPEAPPEDEGEPEPAPTFQQTRPLVVQTPLRPATPEPGRMPPVRMAVQPARPAPRDNWNAPRDDRRQPEPDRSRRPRPKPQAPRIEKSSDPRDLYARLAEIPGRRSEKDAVLVAVWFLSKGERDTAPDEVERHLQEFGGPEGIKVRPHLQKHVNRSKMLDQGEKPGTFRINRKGSGYVLDNLVGA